MRQKSCKGGIDMRCGSRDKVGAASCSAVHGTGRGARPARGLLAKARPFQTESRGHFASLHRPAQPSICSPLAQGGRRASTSAWPTRATSSRERGFTTLTEESCGREQRNRW